jgi:hypothetical protein
MANSSNKRPANDEAEGSRAVARRRWGSPTSSLLDPFSSLTIFFVFSGSSSGILPPLQPRLRPWRAIPWGHLAVPTPPARAIDRDARRFKEEHDATRHELEIISKQARIAELEWEHQCKQLLEAIDGESCNLLNLNLILN